MTALEHGRFLSELVTKSGRAALGQMIAALLDRVPSGYVFGVTDTEVISNVEWTRDAPHKLVSLRLGARAKANMIWDFVHELGHVELGYAPALAGDCAHEHNAWNAGWKIVEDYDASLAATCRSEFVQRMQQCLQTYRGLGAN